MKRTKPEVSKVSEQQGRSDGGSKTEALKVALAQIEKDFGHGAIMQFGEIARRPVEVISTGSVGLDLGLGVGGLPRGRIVEIYGLEASGKSTLAMSVMAQAQKAGGMVAYIDAEHAFDPQYGRKIGINLEELLISQPDTGEQALEIAETLVRSNAVDAVVIDSVAALVPRAEVEAEMGELQIGLQARLMSQALRKLTAAIARSKTVTIFINQIRMKIGVLFGNPETTPGGMALKFYSSVRIELRRAESIKEGDRVIGSRVRAKIVKNKVAPPFRTAEFEILYGEGISQEGELIDLGVTQGVIEKSGSWFTFEGQKISQGREGARAFLKENPKVARSIHQAIKQGYNV